MVECGPIWQSLHLVSLTFRWEEDGTLQNSALNETLTMKLNPSSTIAVILPYESHLTRHSVVFEVNLRQKATGTKKDSNKGS